MKQSHLVGLALLATVVSGCASGADDPSASPVQLDIEQEFDVDPRGTYLRTMWDHPSAPTVVALEAVGASSGDTVRLRRLGEFKESYHRTSDRLAGVFSASDALLPNPSLFEGRQRVVDAIEAGDNVDTPPTAWWHLPTNIQEDFEIGDELEITVPMGATHLFLTAIDDYFKNNRAEYFRIGITVVNDTPDLCDGVSCDDGNACTDDRCDPLSGACESAPVDEGTACDLGGLPGVCRGGLCVDAGLCDGVSCDDGNACTADACDPLDGTCGSTPAPDGTECDAGGVAGQCMAGACVPTDLCAGVDCDDLNQCTSDLCDPGTGACGSTPVADGTSCNLGGLPGICSGGVCEDAMLCAGVSCDDGNACTSDTCDPTDGSCGSTPVADGTSCDFGGLPGTCSAGACEDAMLCAGVVCDDGNECTVGACDPLDGTCGYANAADGTSCGTPGQTCLAGVCQGGSLEPENIDANILCSLPLGLGDVDVAVTIELAPMSVWTGAGSTVSVEGTATVVLAPALGQLMVDLGSDLLTIDYITSEVTVVGGTPTTTVIDIPGQTIDVDANDDGTAEEVVLVIPAGTYDATSAGEATIEFTLTHIETGLSGLPLLGSIVVSETSPPSTIDCSLSSTTAVFPGS